MASWVDRMVGAAKLDAATYEEVEADRKATGQALGVVLISSLGAGIAMVDQGSRGVAVGIVAAVVGWILWAGMTWLLGTKILPEPGTRSDLGELLRTTGFAAAPGVFRVLGAIPIVGWLLQAAVALWMLAAFVVAVRQALDYQSTGRAVIVCAIGWLIYFSATIAAMLMLGGALVATGVRVEDSGG